MLDTIDEILADVRTSIASGDEQRTRNYLGMLMHYLKQMPIDADRPQLQQVSRLRLLELVTKMIAVEQDDILPILGEFEARLNTVARRLGPPGAQ